ncbi:DNA repair protein rad51c [Allomyces arbusculus]|nr:DNA repair protein rad51c [Allomyces arbusculus]
MSNRPISSLALDKAAKRKLLAAGFNWTKDLTGLSAADLAAEAGLAPADAELVLRVRDSGSAVPPPAAAEPPSVLGQGPSNASPTLTTGVPELDVLLGQPNRPGLAIGALYELTGVPGIGTTQFCMQLCARVQLPQHFGGLYGRAIIVDTTGGYQAPRQSEIAAAVADSIGAPADAVASMLQGIAYYRLFSPVEVIALVNVLPDILRANDGVRLLVFDSISFPFTGGKLGLVQSILSALRELAETFQLIVVITSTFVLKRDDLGHAYRMDPAAALTTAPTGNPGENSTKLQQIKSMSLLAKEQELPDLTPVGTNWWSNLVDVHAMLFWDYATRVAFLRKGALTQSFARFRITNQGVVADVQPEHDPHV